MLFMANEASIVYEIENPVPFIVADAAGIEKGALCRLSGSSMTAATMTATNQAVAGIAATEKIANSGVTTLGIFRRGIARVYLSGSCTIGDALVFGTEVNYVKKQPNYNTLSGANQIGVALETGTTGSQILVALNPTQVVFA